MFINNQKDFLLGVANHALQEICEHAIPKPLPKYHKRKMSFVRHGRNLIASEALSCSGDNRGFTWRTLGATWSMVRSQSHLDTSINLGFFALRLCMYPWILMRKLVLHCFCLPWFQRFALCASGDNERASCVFMPKLHHINAQNENYLLH